MDGAPPAPAPSGFSPRRGCDLCCRGRRSIELSVPIRQPGSLSRRRFLRNSAILAAAGLAQPLRVFSGTVEQGRYRPIADNLPARPKEKPLPWKAIADAFDGYVFDPANGILMHRADGSPFFASATESKNDGGLTTFGPLLLGKILRGDDISAIAPALGAYFHERAGIFVDGAGADLMEYWYLMNVNSLAAGIIRSKWASDAVWTGRLRKSLDRLIAIARQIQYNFNDQGYDFSTNAAWTKQDIYRQPDAIAGYAYLMLFGHEALGGETYLKEARSALARYQSFAKNPWYEIPSGAMGCLAAARLSAHHRDAGADVRKALSFALDPLVGCLQTGEWGGREVNGLMGGWCTEPPGVAYSMESMVALPYLLPVLRYHPEYATDIGKYALNAATNLRWFYTAYLPPELQSKSGFAPAIPYERLSRELHGHSPYAAGDYDGHRSVYGGAYALWWGELVQPTEDDFILRLDLAKTDFLARSSYSTYLYYNPWPGKREVKCVLPSGQWDVYDTLAHRFIREGSRSSLTLAIPGAASRVIVVIPAGKKRQTVRGVLFAGDVTVDYHADGS